MFSIINGLQSHFVRNCIVKSVLWIVSPYLWAEHAVSLNLTLDWYFWLWMDSITAESVCCLVTDAVSWCAHSRSLSYYCPRWSGLTGIRPGNIPTACIQKWPQLVDRKCIAVWMASLCKGRSLPTCSDADLRSQESGGDASASLCSYHTFFSFIASSGASSSCLCPGLSSSAWRSPDSLMLFCEFSSLLFLAALCSEDERASGWEGWESTRVETLWCPGTWRPLVSACH